MIVLDQKNRIFTLHTKNTTYQMKADGYNVLLHTYYGPRIDGCYLSDQIQCAGRSFSPNPSEAGSSRDYSLDIMPQEYSTCGVGDFRLPSVELELPNGSHTADLRYTGYRLQPGKYTLPGLPAFYGSEAEAETLVISLEDPAAQVEVELYYGVFERFDLITRAVRVVNQGTETVCLCRCASVSGLPPVRPGHDYLFGKRNDDNSGLGDWYVNTEKLPGGLESLVPEIQALGMKFGIWIEPEMVNEDSRLYREHPDWVLHVPGRAPARGRGQLVLDFSRTDVRDHIYSQLTAVLSSAEISYIKWDMNRSLTDVWSAALPAGRQGEVFHRYVLGVYDFLERLRSDYPHILIEGCCGGGGRFDGGMLYYTPQIWCSDDTDAIDRLRIQYGTSFCYPVCTMGAHVSAVPNEQNGRVTPLETRGITAMSGAFGYEMDLSRCTQEEREGIRRQVETYKARYELLHGGDYYRLSSPFQENSYTAWEQVSPDRREALVNVVLGCTHAAPPFRTL